MTQIVREKSEQMNQVLFLDFDGPLFSDRYISFHAANRREFPGSKLNSVINYWKMDPLAVEMLNELHDTFPFTTVVSSSWKRFIDRDQCLELFEVNDLNLTLADDWSTIRLDRPFGHGYCVRASEISEFIIRHSIEEFIVLDDPQSGFSLDEENLTRRAKHGDDDDEAAQRVLDAARIVLVNPDVGIGSADFLQMRKIVRQWAGIPEHIKGTWGI